MGPYSGSSPFDQSVEKATSDSTVEEDWGLIIEICDRVAASSTGPKDCLRSIMKRLENSSARVQMHALVLLDACVKNCGSVFHKEMANSTFTQEAHSLIKKASVDPGDKFKILIQGWAEKEFKSDSSLSAIPSLYTSLRNEGAYFGMGKAKSTVSSTAGSDKGKVGKEEDDIAKAIALSLSEAAAAQKKTSSLYPSMTSSSPAPRSQSQTQSRLTSGRQVRALYDFEAVEDNELTFKAGETLTVLDDSDANWWKGSTWRGEGLFPANFVTGDLSAEIETTGQDKKGVQFNEEVTVQTFDPNSVQISEATIDEALDMIQNADPTGCTEDAPEMLQLEEECKVMGPMIDRQLEQIDKKHNELMALNQKLVESFQLYAKLMSQSVTSSPRGYPGALSTHPEQQAYSTAQYGQAMHAYQRQPAPPMQGYYPPGTGMYNPPVEEQAQQPQPQYQGHLLQQYQGQGTSLNNVPYIPTGVNNPTHHNGYQTPLS